MPSFDLVSKTDLMEIKNALQMAQKEISSRYDFKGGEASIELVNDKEIVIITDTEYKIKAALEIFRGQMVKRKIGQRCIGPQKVQPFGNRQLKQIIEIKNGIEKEKAKLINKLIKDSGLKVQSAILDDKIRLTGKKIDDLQDVIALCRSSNFGIPLQYENMKS